MEEATASSCSYPTSPPARPLPAISPVSLSETFEELLRLVLSSGLHGANGDGHDLALSPEYCAGLLRDDPEPFHPQLSDVGDFCGGVPEYPLYKHLARAMERCIHLGSFVSSASTSISIPVNESFKMKESEWSKLIVDKGSELFNMLKVADFELHVQEPFFSQLKVGLKTVEGRCALGKYNRVRPDSVILFNKCLLLKVQHVNHYNSFSEMLQIETLDKVLPGVETIEDGVHIYRRFYSVEQERCNGVLAISVTKPAPQPYIVMSCLLSGLSYEGISSLLGMAHTIGSVPHELPPPRSILVPSSMKPIRPDEVKGCSLTDAARALAKHVDRSSEGWWGNFCGSDSNKNMLALAVIKHILSHCCWMNIHLIQPHECVFEIRVPEGYGARWSKDGSKFIGFLEPYSEEGFSQGWKH